MTTKQDEKNEKRPLMSDEQFAELMQNEFRTSKSNIDELEKKKVWQKLNNRIKLKPGKRLWIPAAAAALLLIFILPLNIHEPSVDDFQRIKGVVSAVDVTLQAVGFDNNQSIDLTENKTNVNETLLFKVSLPSNAYVALIYASNHQKPEVKFISQQLSSGVQQYIKRDERTYGYVVEASDKHLQFCAIASITLKDIEQQVNQLEKLWQTLPAQACAKIDVRNDAR